MPFRPWRYAAIALAAIVARLPFLLRADRFFDADEAVEGLMARHLGDHSLFMWGQRYKGTPEVFLTGAVFRVAGSGVIALKAVTLACFVVFLCLHFRLLERVFSRGIAWTATAFLIAGPPSLVLWTLSGSAEIVMTFIAGTVLLLAVDNWRRTAEGSSSATLKGSLYIAAAALGVGLWIQPYILYYVVSLAITAAIVMPEWRRQMLADAGRRTPAWLRVVLMMLTAIALLYVVLGFIPFFMMQVHVTVAGVPIAVTHPQKMWWLAGTFFASAVIVAGVAMFRERLIAPGLAFLAGYSPAIIGRIGNHGLGSPIYRLDVAGLLTTFPDMRGVMVPILLGFRDPLGRPVAFVPLALVLVAVIAVSCWHVHHRRLVPFFHVLPVVAVAIFLVSGSYIDAQSYRYLMPIYAGLPVVYALGVDAAWRTNRAAGIALLAFMLTLFASQQIGWYQHLEPDRASERAIACLDAAGIRAARAPYWQSYSLTFLTNERIIVAPTDGQDRHAPYAEATRNAPLLESVLASCR